MERILTLVVLAIFSQSLSRQNHIYCYGYISTEYTSEAQPEISKDSLQSLNHEYMKIPNQFHDVISYTKYSM